jgi:hypothetical protein
MKLTHVLLHKMKTKSHCRGTFVNGSSLIFNPPRWWACKLLENTTLECLISTKNSSKSGKGICGRGKREKDRDSIEEKHCVGSSAVTSLGRRSNDTVEVEHSEESLVFMKIPRRPKGSSCQLPTASLPRTCISFPTGLRAVLEASAYHSSYLASKFPLPESFPFSSVTLN